MKQSAFENLIVAQVVKKLPDKLNQKINPRVHKITPPLALSLS